MGLVALRPAAWEGRGAGGRAVVLLGVRVGGREPGREGGGRVGRHHGGGPERGSGGVELGVSVDGAEVGGQVGRGAPAEPVLPGRGGGV